MRWLRHSRILSPFSAKESGCGRVKARLRSAVDRIGLGTKIRRWRDERAVRTSGLIDREWYLEQVGPLPIGTDLVRHYVRVGAAQGLSPHPCFDPDWYVPQHREAAAGGYSPLGAFVLSGAAFGFSPHPSFDATWYLSRYPTATSHPLGPLGHYLSEGAKTGAEPHPRFNSQVYRRRHADLEEMPFVHFARELGRVVRETRGTSHIPRTTRTFDHASSDDYKRRLLAAYQGSPQPLVSVILPTKNRGTQVLDAIDSVTKQSYRNWELIVVDDGSTDGTPALLDPLTNDPRVRLVVREQSGGVAVARNEGLRSARGEYVAFLDSDNTWLPDFLEIMVASAVITGSPASYAASELVGSGRHEFRAMEFDQEALRERNYIDCIVVLLERSLIETIGGFDESLRRMVDWDLLVRVSAITPLRYVPVIATRYDLWEDREDRVTQSEGWGYRFVIRSKQLIDWSTAEDDLDLRDPDLVSIVTVARGDERQMRRSLTRLLEDLPESGVEVLVVDPHLPTKRFYELHMMIMDDERVRVLRLSTDESWELCCNVGLLRTRGAVVALLSCEVVPEPGMLPPLVEALGSGAVAAAPIVLDTTGTILTAGMVSASVGSAHHVLEGLPREAADGLEPSCREGLAAVGLVTTARDLVLARGLDPFYIDALDSPDLSRRLATHAAGKLVSVPSSRIVLGPIQRRQGMRSPVPDNRRAFASRWAGGMEGTAAVQWGGAGLAVVGYEGRSPGDLTSVGWHRPLLAHDRPDRPRRWAIKIATPDMLHRQGWGDYYFAQGLQAALLRLGEQAFIDLETAWYRPTSHLDDISLVIRGKRTYIPNPQHVNLLWIISHPSDVVDVEMVGYDAIYSAGEPFTQHLRRLAPTVRVETLLQCTDPARFPAEPSSPQNGGVVFVGNTRGVFRPIVRHALEAGLSPIVYGHGWDQFVPGASIGGIFVPNEAVHMLYRTASVVLNDHWHDMRRWGFVSNRLFDLAACSARFITDDVPGIRSVFGDVACTYDDTVEGLTAAAKRVLNETREEAQARRDLAVYVQSHHSFDARARQLLEEVRSLPLHTSRR